MKIKLKESIILIIAIIIAIVVGVFVGIKISENNSGAKEQNNNGNQQNNIEVSEEQKLKRVHDTSLEENLKGNNISYVNPLVSGKLVFNSSESTTANFNFTSKDVLIVKEDSEVIITMNGKKETISSEDSSVKVYVLNNYLVVYNGYPGGTTDVTVYNEKFIEVLGIRSDMYGFPLFANQYILWRTRL